MDQSISLSFICHQTQSILSSYSGHYNNLHLLSLVVDYICISKKYANVLYTCPYAYNTCKTD